jgi:hypothetical protein
VSFIPMPKYTKHDRKFLEEYAQRRGINGAVIISYGEIHECDYDELKRDFRRHDTS